MKLSIIIPVFNEAATIEEIIRRVLDTRFDKEVLVVDDCSGDGTRDLLCSRYKDHPTVKTFFHEVNRGKTAAIRTALRHVTGDIVIIQDADLEYNPQDYRQLIRPIVQGKADVVYGSRFLYVNKYLFMWHWFLNKFLGRHYEIRYLSHFLGIQFLNVVALLLYWFRTTDIATGYKVFKADIFKEITLMTDRFEFCYEITAKIAKRRYRLKETRIHYHPRSDLRGKKITWKDGIWATWALLRFRFSD